MKCVIDAMGFLVARTKIESFNGEGVLVVERFDRKIVENKIYRLPQEDFCQALGVVGASKYEEYGGPSGKDIMGILSTSTARLYLLFDYLT